MRAAELSTMRIGDECMVRGALVRRVARNGWKVNAREAASLVDVMLTLAHRR